MFISRNTRRRGPRKCSPRNRSSAFTLVEVVLAMIIIALIATAIYGMINATVRSASSLQEREDRLQQLSGFLTLCRKTFHTIPASATFQARLATQDADSYQEIIFRNAPGMFRWGDQSNVYLSTIFGVRPQVGGLVSLGILQDTEDEINSYLNGGTAKRSWLILFTDLRKVEWRFYDPRTLTWSTTWTDLTVHPAFAELTLTTENGSEKYLFWIPPVKAPQT